MPRMKRSAEILDCATGTFRKTGEGAVFIGRVECEKALADLRRLDLGVDARFVVDWHDRNGNLLETFGIDERGFRRLTGEAPKSPTFYEKYDGDYWAGLFAERNAAKLLNVELPDAR